jgi:hypothetical protein
MSLLVSRRHRLVVLAASAGIVLLAGACLSLRPKPISRNRIYRIGYNQNSPFQVRTADGRPAGFAIDTLNAAARRAGIQLEWIYDPSSSATLLRDKKVELWPFLIDVPERRSFAYISDPWLVSHNYLIVRGACAELPPADFAGTIQYSGPSIYASLIRNRWPKARTSHFANPLETGPRFCAGHFSLLSRPMSSCRTLPRCAPQWSTVPTTCRG